MANLIIKPTSGGSLVLQDEGGDAALTVGTTGVSTIANATITPGTITAATFPAGHIVQVVQTIKTDTWTTTANGNNPTLVTGLACAITPASTSNKILVQVSVYASATAYSHYIWVRHNGSGSYANLSNGSDASVGDASGSTTQVMFGGQGGTAEADEASTATMSFLDSPSKNTAFTYQVYACQRAAGTMYINRPASATDAAYISRGISSLTLSEIQG